MSTALVIATREIRERSRLFIVAAALAILPFAIALVPGARGNRPYAIMIFGAAAAFNYACAIALAMGVSTIGRDLSEKRLSFYFAKPVSPLSLWIGKAGASLLVAILSSLIIAVPSFLAASHVWTRSWITGGYRIGIAWPIALLLLFFGSHAIATMTRSRSVLVAVDFVLAVLMAGAVAALFRPILLAGGMEVTKGLAIALGAGFLIVLAIAPVWQLANGRTDIRRSHREFSKFLWSAIAVLLLAAASFVLWLRSVSPAELVEVRDVQQAPAGGWALVTGIGNRRGDFHSTFLMDAKSGGYSRLATPPWSAVQWSRDGRVAAWLQPIGLRPQGRCELVVQTAGEKESVGTGIEVSMWSRFALSDDGSRAAVASDKVIAIHDLKAHRILAAAGDLNDVNPRMFFVTNDVLRILHSPRALRNQSTTLRVADLDVRTRKLTAYGQRDIVAQYNPISVSGDGSRMFVRTSGEIVDGRTLATIAKIVPSAPWGSAMLNDGSVVVIDKTSGVRMRMFDRDGHPRSELALPNVTNAFLSGETTDGKLIAVGASAATRSMFVIDRAKLAIERTVPDVKGPMPQWLVDPRTTRYEAAQPFVGVDGKGKLKVWSAAGA